MRDLNLAIVILRLCPRTAQITEEKLKAEKEKLLDKFFINFGKAVKDPWLLCYGFLQKEEYGLAFSSLINFKENLVKVVETNTADLEECYPTVNSVIKLGYLDEDIFHFAKIIENYYSLQQDNIVKNVKNVENTNFDDLWDDFDYDKPQEDDYDEVEETKEHEQVSGDLQELKEFSLSVTLEKGILFSPFHKEVSLKIEESLGRIFVLKLASRIKYESMLIIHNKLGNPDAYFDCVYEVLHRQIKLFGLEEKPILSQIASFFLFLIKKKKQRLQNMSKHQH